MAFQIAGWVGMTMILGAYGLMSLKVIKPGLAYQLLNLAGCGLMAVGLFPTEAWFSFTLQIVWGIIAIVAIIKIVFDKDKKNKNKHKKY